MNRNSRHYPVDPQANYRDYQRQRQMTLGDLLLENRIILLQGEIHDGNANELVMKLDARRPATTSVDARSSAGANQLRRRLPWGRGAPGSGRQWRGPRSGPGSELVTLGYVIGVVGAASSDRASPSRARTGW